MITIFGINSVDGNSRLAPRVGSLHMFWFSFLYGFSTLVASIRCISVIIRKLFSYISEICKMIWTKIGSNEFLQTMRFSFMIIHI